jgi:hypothetical protein
LLLQVGLSQLVAGRIELRDAARAAPNERAPVGKQRRKAAPSLEDEFAAMQSQLKVGDYEMKKITRRPET